MGENKIMKILNFKKFFWLASLLAVFSFQLALAESEIPENLVPLANELGCQTKEECAKVFDANFESSVMLAEKYQVYSKEQSEIAKSYKQEVISKLSGLSEENFEEEIVKIAKELLKNPKLAKSFQLDKDSVTAAETIVTEVKNAGVGVDICSQSAETLSREQLIGCLEASKKLAKKSAIVQKYIPKGVIEKTNMADMAASLDEALAKGDYPELGKTAEEAGQKCLKSGSELLKSCDEIAQKFFGPEGVKELAAARTRTKQAGDFYLKGLENLELVTSDGRKIAGKTAIKNACEKAFETRDVKLARSCGEFAVKNGFTSQKEMDDGLKIFESMADKNINFDQCRSNPELCEEFIPEEHRKEFEGNKKIYEIMKTEAGFDPIECERGNVDFEIGRKCFEASQKALPKLKEIAADYPEVQRMVRDIEFGIKKEGEQKQRGDDFGKFFSQQAGPGGCKNEEECFAYCNDSAHGAECISFGAKHEVFQGDEAVERYQKYNQNNFGGPGPSPECFAAIQSGDFVKAKEICSIPANPYQYQPPYQVYPDDRYRSEPNYQQSSNSSYPSYDEKERCYRGGGFWTGNYCDYQNRSASSSSVSSSYSSYEISYSSSSYSSYPSSSSSAYSSYSYSSYPSYSSCTNEMVSLLGAGCHFMYNDSSNTAVYCNGEMTKSAKLGDTAAKDGCQSGSGYSSYGYYSSGSSYSSYNYPQCDWSSQYLKNSTQTCMPRTYCYDTASAEYNSSECQGVRGSSSYSSYSYSSYPSSAYSSYAYSSYPSSAYSSYSYSSYSPASSEAAYSSYSSASYSSADYSTACAQAGGTWDGSYCQMPQSSSAAAYSSAAYSSYDPSSSCAQAGGTWDGSVCQMPNSGSSSSATQNPAAAGWLFGKIINFFNR